MLTRYVSFLLTTFLMILVGLNAFSQDIKFNEVRILNKSSRGQFIEFKNNSNESISMRELFLSSSKENLSESAISNGARYLRTNSVASLPVNHKYYTQIHFEDNEKRTLYLGILENEKMVILDSISFPVLDKHESYAKVNGVFSVQPVATPNLENWETKLQELLHRKQLSFGAGPNINFPKANGFVKNEISSRASYGFDLRFIMNSKSLFYTVNTGYFNRNYNINSDVTTTLPSGELRRVSEGVQKLGQLKIGYEIGTHITSRLSIMAGVNVALIIRDIQEFNTISTFTLGDGTIIEENSDETEKKDFPQGPALDIYYSLGIKYFHTNRIVSGLTFMSDVTGKVSEGAVRNKTVQLYISYLLNLSKKTVPKDAIIK